MSREQLIATLCLMLYGCQQGTVMPEIRHPQTGAQTERRPGDTDCRPGAGSNVAQWLEERDRLCRLSMDQQKLQFRQIEDGKNESIRENRMKRMLLSSCQPDRTPGLLRQSLDDVAKIDDLSPDERQLVELVRSFEQSNRILESRNQNLKSDLEETVNGIREIETDIGGMDKKQVKP